MGGPVSFRRRLEDGYQCLVLVLMLGVAGLLGAVAGAFVTWSVIG